MTKVYSCCGEKFFVADDIEEFATQNELEVGDTYFEGVLVKPDLTKFFDGEAIVEMMSDYAWSEFDQDDYGNAIDDDAIAELKSILAAWAERHAAPDFFAVTDIEECVYTM